MQLGVSMWMKDLSLSDGYIAKVHPDVQVAPWRAAAEGAGGEGARSLLLKAGEGQLRTDPAG